MMEFLDQGLRRLLVSAQIKLFLAVLTFEIGSFLIGSVYPMSLETATATTKVYNGSVQGIYTLNPFFMWAEIVSHNATITALEFFPFLGMLVNFISTFTTGQIIHASAISQGTSSIGSLAVAAGLFLFPHTLIEFSAYALATSSSIIFLIALFKRKDTNKEILRTFSRAIAASLFLLAIAGAIEVVTIVYGLIAALFWFPVIYGANYLSKWPKRQGGGKWNTSGSSSPAQ